VKAAAPSQFFLFAWQRGGGCGIAFWQSLLHDLVAAGLEQKMASQPASVSTLGIPLAGLTGRKQCLIDL
jgi:hypothetical protein